jgi:hypothetical protein
VCKYFRVNIFFKKRLYYAIDHTTVRSIAYTGLRSNSLACVRAQRPTSHTHFCTNAIARGPNHHVTLFRSLSSLFHLIFSLAPFSSLYPSSPFFSHIPTISPPKHIPFTTISPPPILQSSTPSLHRLRRSHFYPFSKNFTFCPCFLMSKGTNPPTDCPFFLFVLVSYIFAGGWVRI